MYEPHVSPGCPRRAGDVRGRSADYPCGVSLPVMFRGILPAHIFVNQVLLTIQIPCLNQALSLDGLYYAVRSRNIE